MQTAKNAFFLFILFFVALSCNKNGLGSQSITYELKALNGTIDIVSYLDESGSNTVLQNINSKTWTITFKNKIGKPRMLMVQGMNIFGYDVEGTIKYEGKVVKTLIGPGIAQVIYNLN